MTAADVWFAQVRRRVSRGVGHGSFDCPRVGVLHVSGTMLQRAGCAVTGRDLERGLYKTARDLGDFNAAQRGTKPLARRLVRRQVTRRLTGPLTARLIRMLIP